MISLLMNLVSLTFIEIDESLVNQQNLREFSPVDKAEIFQRIMKDQHQILVVDNQKKHIRDSKKTH